MPRLAKKARSPQKETLLQKSIINTLTIGGFGNFFRIRNGATFDPKIGKYRSNTAEPGIPDILGWQKNTARMIAIEVKYVEVVQKRIKLKFSIRISEEQKAFLRNAHESGVLTGIAFNVQDAIAIAADDPDTYLRHPRTYGFMDDAWLDSYIHSYRIKKGIIAKEMQDPVERQLKHES